MAPGRECTPTTVAAREVPKGIKGRRRVRAAPPGPNATWGDTNPGGLSPHRDHSRGPGAEVDDPLWTRREKGHDKLRS